MKKHNNNKDIVEELKHASPAKPGKRFLAFMIDCVLVCIFSFLIFIVGNLINTNTNSYKNADSIIKEEIDYYNNFVEQSRAVEFEIINNEKVRKDLIKEDTSGFSKIVLENVNRALYYSYLEYGDFCNQFGFEINEKNMNIIKASISNKGYDIDDNISYFYTNYVYNSNEQLGVSFESILDAKKYVQQIYKESFSNNAEIMFEFNNVDYSVPLLKSEVAYYIYYYIYVFEDEEITKKGQDYSFIYFNAYSSMLSAAEKIVIQSEPYYSTHYVKYYENKAIVARNTIITLIISIVISYLLVVMIPKLLLKHGRTIGRYVFKLGEISYENEVVSTLSIIINTIFGSFGYLAVMPILFMFHPFNGSFNAMYLPFIGNIPFLIIMIIIIGLVLINSCCILFTKNKVGINGLVTNSILVDRKFQDELIIED